MGKIFNKLGFQPLLAEEILTLKEETLNFLKLHESSKNFIVINKTEAQEFLEEHGRRNELAQMIMEKIFNKAGFQHLAEEILSLKAENLKLKVYFKVFLKQHESSENFIVINKTKAKKFVEEQETLVNNFYHCLDKIVRNRNWPPKRPPRKVDIKPINLKDEPTSPRTSPRASPRTSPRILISRDQPIPMKRTIFSPMGYTETDKNIPSSLSSVNSASASENSQSPPSSALAPEQIPRLRSSKYLQGNSSSTYANQFGNKSNQQTPNDKPDDPCWEKLQVNIGDLVEELVKSKGKHRHQGYEYSEYLLKILDIRVGGGMEAYLFSGPSSAFLDWRVQKFFGGPLLI